MPASWPDGIFHADQELLAGHGDLDSLDRERLDAACEGRDVVDAASGLHQGDHDLVGDPDDLILADLAVFDLGEPNPQGLDPEAPGGTPPACYDDAMRSGLEIGFALDRRWHLMRSEDEGSKKPALLLLGRVFADAAVPYAIIGGVAL